MIYKTYSTKLRSEEKNNIINLLKICNSNDTTNIHLDCNDIQSVYFSLYINKVLISVITYYLLDNDTYDCTFFTHPYYRRMGYFKQLFIYSLQIMYNQYFCKYLNFIVDGNNIIAKKILKKCYATYYDTDYIMYFNFSNIPQPIIDEVNILSTNGSLYHIMHNNIKVGKFYITHFNSSVYLYKLIIFKKYRHKYFAYTALCKLIGTLSSNKTILLEVSKSNIPAFSLYKKLGFIIQETKETWSYSIQKK